MKYVKKMPSTDMELSARLHSEGLIKIKEPSNIWVATLISMPLAFLLGNITLIITQRLNPTAYHFLKFDTSFNFEITFNLFTLLYIITIFAFMFLHEIIHAIFIPNFMKSEKTFWGLNGAFGFVFTTEKIKKSRYLIISIMPFILLSVILPYILALFNLLNGYMIFLCLLNAMGSCVDFLNVCLIVLQVPNQSIIINNGFETYYKPKGV